MYLSIDLIVIFLGGINYQSVNLISFLTPLRSFGFYPLEMPYTIIHAMKMLAQQKHNITHLLKNHSQLKQNKVTIVTRRK